MRSTKKHSSKKATRLQAGRKSSPSPKNRKISAKPSSPKKASRRQQAVTPANNELAVQGQILRLEEKIVTLESSMAFQDMNLEELNKVLTEYSLKIDLITLKLRELSKQLPSNVDSSNEPPPHY